MIWHTFGHQNVKNILEKQISSGHFAHAYLFSGSEGLGKKTLALEFAKRVLQTEKLENHPDFQILDTEGEITVEQILGFIGSLGFKPFVGSKKVAIINNAHNLNTQSSNALLKTLEEPSQSTIIILIVGSGKLLPTIVSRCQTINFSRISLSGLKEFAEDKKLTCGEEVLRLSFGRPARLKKLVQDEAFYKDESAAVLDYLAIQKLSLGERLGQISAYAEKETAELEQNLLTWLFWQAEHLGERPEEYMKTRVILDSLAAFGRNQNKKLVLQGLFLKI